MTGITIENSRCPDLEEIAAYVDGLLNGEKREALETHLADCDVCREFLAEVALTPTFQDKPTGYKPLERKLRVARWVILILLACAVAYFLGLYLRPN